MGTSATAPEKVVDGVGQERANVWALGTQAREDVPCVGTGGDQVPHILFKVGGVLDLGLGRPQVAADVAHLPQARGGIGVDRRCGHELRAMANRRAQPLVLGLVAPDAASQLLGRVRARDGRNQVDLEGG